MASGVAYGVISGLQISKKKNHQKSPKMCYFSHIFGIRAISPIHWFKCLIGTYIVECPNAKSVIHGVTGVVCGLISGLQRPQKSKKSPKNDLFFKYIFAIAVILSIHWIKLTIGTFMIECPKDKIIIHRASGVGYGVISELQRPQKPFKKNTKNWLFSHILGFRAISPIHWITWTNIVQCPNGKLIIFVMYVPMRNLIQCIGDMALLVMPKICEK